MFSVLENSVNLDAVKFDAFYLVKLIFGKYLRDFDVNHVADLLQLHLQLDSIRVLVRERVNFLPLIFIAFPVIFNMIVTFLQEELDLKKIRIISVE